MPRAVVDDRDPDGVRPALLGPTSQSSLVVLLPEAVQEQLKRQRLTAPHAAPQVALEVTFALEPPTAGLIFTWDRPATDLKGALWTSCYTQTEVGSGVHNLVSPNRGHRSSVRTTFAASGRTLRACLRARGSRRCRAGTRGAPGPWR